MLLICAFSFDTTTKEATITANFQPLDTAVKLLHDILLAEEIRKVREAQKPPIPPEKKD